MGRKIVTTVQACEERLDYIKPIAEKFDAIIHVDKKRQGSLISFIDMLDYKVSDYRFHIQDDIIIAVDLPSYLPVLAKFMEANDIHMLSLFAPARQTIRDQYQIGKRFISYGNFLGPLGVMFSREFVDKMREHAPDTKQTMHDDYFIQEVLNKMGKKPILHLPVLVQHNTEIQSINAHPSETYTTSDVFDIDFVINYNIQHK